MRYEWDTYLTEVLAGRKKEDNIFTLRMDGMAIRDMPIGLRKYQSFDASDIEQLYMWVNNALCKSKRGARETLVYPAVFTRRDMYEVYFPDLDIRTMGVDLRDAYSKADSMLEMYISYCMKCGAEYAKPSAFEDVCRDYPDSVVMYIDSDVDLGVK